MPHCRRHHRWIAVIALLGLLLQQFALAAYACPMGRGVAHAAAAKPSCHGQEEASDRGDPVRCQAHCHPQPTSADHAPSPTVPAALLPATTWWRGEDAGQPGHAAAPRAELMARATAPPLNVQHCSLQI